MATEVQIALQPQAGQDPAAALTTAAAKLARASLEMLVQQAGQPVTGKILPPPQGLPAGFSQVAVADLVLTLKLSTPLPAGTPVRIDVQQTAGQPAVTVQPIPPSTTQPQSTPAPLPQAAVPLPSMPRPAAPLIQQASPSPAQPSATAAPAPAAPSAPAPAAVPAPQTQVAGQSPVAPQAAPLPAAASPSTPAPAQPNRPAAPAMPTSAPQVATASAQSATPNLAPSQPAPTPVPPSVTVPPSDTARSDCANRGDHCARPTSPIATGSCSDPTIGTYHCATAGAGGRPELANTSANRTWPDRGPASGADRTFSGSRTDSPARCANRTGTAAPASHDAAADAGIRPISGHGGCLTASARPGSPAQLVMAATTQAAAQQQSPAPLMQALTASLPHLPTPVAEAAARVLATRISLDRGGPTGDALKQAVLKSGVFLDAPAKANAAPDLRQALGQLRGTLLAWLGDDIAPVAAVARRPSPPPTRGSMPRGQAPELPQAMEGGVKEAGKSLLGQTDSALARIRLMQLGSQPMEAARPGAAIAAPTEWTLELPMMLGHELAMAQIQIQRDGKGKTQAKDKNWRLRFALKFSVLGEVGAQVTMVGTRASIAIWADEEATAATLEEMLPELAPALSAKGLELVSLTVRRGVPKDENQPAGRLMDSVR